MPGFMAKQETCGILWGRKHEQVGEKEEQGAPKMRSDDCWVETVKNKEGSVELWRSRSHAEESL